MSRKKTRAEKLAQGDTRQRGAKKLSQQIAREPRMQSGLACPAHLQGDAADLFRFFADELELSGLDAKPDSQALAIASDALARAWKAARMLRRQGEIRSIPILAGVGRARKVVGSRQVRNRWFSVMIESQKLFDRVAGKFGLVGPQSRAGLEVVHSPSIEKRNPALWEMLNRPRSPRVPLPEEIAWQAKQAAEQPKEPKSPEPESPPVQ